MINPVLRVKIAINKGKQRMCSLLTGHKTVGKLYHEEVGNKSRQIQLCRCGKNVYIGPLLHDNDFLSGRAYGEHGMDGKDSNSI